MTWNYRVLRYQRGEATWYALHEVYYDEEGRPRAYTAEPATFVGIDEDDGRESIAQALRLALNDAEARPVLDAEKDFPASEEEVTAGEAAELERDRLEAIARRDEEAADPDWRDAGAPGTPGCHEALHLAHVFVGLIDRELLNHPAVLLNPDWYARVSRACGELADLYQAIGAEHLEKLPPSR